MKGKFLLKIYEELLRVYGHQHWWPGDTPWEICVGAVLTQNTSWTNVEKAIARLKTANALKPDAVLRLSRAELEDALMPSGFFRIKADRLLKVTRWWLGNVIDDKPLWQGRTPAEFRRDLLCVHGVGPETADSIMLYCFQQPFFVIDAYTRRIFSRHFQLEEKMDYHHLQSIFMDNLPADHQLFNEYHALIVKAAKEHCRKNQCLEGCPLCRMIEKQSQIRPTS
ncbi:MAG: hypothetical protein JXR78_12275 [Victivallales bacterium]|nr:hypothetical protein [Victivallales bacterium]